MLLSLFCGAGGLDLGFESAGFEIGLAFDKRSDSVASYNHNRSGRPHAFCEDVTALTLRRLDELWGSEFTPVGVIGGPPCQSFSKANTVHIDDDPRHSLPLTYAALLKALNTRSPVSFFVMENVTGLTGPRHARRLVAMKQALINAGFVVSQVVLNSVDYRTPQYRERLFLIGLNRETFSGKRWVKPKKTTKATHDLSVRGAIGGLAEPTFFSRGLNSSEFEEHVNHWCMTPKSKKFETPGALVPGNGNHRSFKTLSWDQPSPTVAYGHREVHIHPNCKRRLSVYEAMLLQGFPARYELLGTLSSQITQISEAVPPPLAEAVARSIMAQVRISPKVDEPREMAA